MYVYLLYICSVIYLGHCYIQSYQLNILYNIPVNIILRCFTDTYLAKNQKVYCAFIDLEKAFDRVMRNEMQSALSKFRLGSQLVIKCATRTLDEDSRADVRINRDALTSSASLGVSNRDEGHLRYTIGGFNLFMDNFDRVA